MKQNEDMKKIVSIVFFSILLFSCGKQDTVYKEFVKEGGYIYPAKPLELTAKMGYQRIFLEWMAPMDPSIRTTKLFWDNYTDSLVFSVSDYVDGFLTAEVSGLDDRSYTFDVINYDAAGNKSLASEITTTPFGESWLLSHSERSFVSAEMDGDVALVKMGKSTDEMVATKFRYVTASGETVESDYLEAGDVEARLPNALKGSRLSYKSAFLPSNGIDTVWVTSWTPCEMPIVYPLPTEGWTVTVTTGQVDQNYTPDKILDGIVSLENSWCSARTGRVFPKILSIDTGCAPGDEYLFTRFAFYLNPGGNVFRYIRDVKIYIGNEPYNPNDKAAVDNFGEPALAITLNRNSAIQEFDMKDLASGRYWALLFPNSFNSNGLIDLWEVVPYGYKVSEAQ